VGDVPRLHGHGERVWEEGAAEVGSVDGQLDGLQCRRRARWLYIQADGRG
jgi:hypothetical protein